MLTLDATLPETALLDAPRRQAVAAFTEAGAHWFRADPEHLGCDPDRDMGVVWLGSITSDMRADPATPNRSNSVFQSESPHPGLVFRAGVNCGFQLALAEGAGAAFSLAMRFAAPVGDVSTLMTLNPKKGDNYLFLQRKSGVYIAKDKATTVQAELPAELGPDVSLVVMAFEKGQVFLRAGGARALSEARPDLEFSGPATLFLGCRNNRGGLQKTLGHFVLTDATMIPGRNILRDGGDPLLSALERHHAWDF